MGILEEEEEEEEKETFETKRENSSNYPIRIPSQNSSG